MKALVVNCTLKKSPETSNTEAPANVVVEHVRKEGVEVDVVRAVDLDIAPGVTSEPVYDGDAWPGVHGRLLESEILVIASPVACNRVAGVVVTGNEDGAHHVINEITGGLEDIGYTIPGQAWTYWNQGPGPGPSFLDAERGHDWSRSTGRARAANLLGVARALAARPLGPPPR
jgi:hypothetical protein